MLATEKIKERIDDNYRDIGVAQVKIDEVDQHIRQFKNDLKITIIVHSLEKIPRKLKSCMKQLLDQRKMCLQGMRPMTGLTRNMSKEATHL